MKNLMDNNDFGKIVEDVERTFLRRKVAIGKCKIDDFLCGAMAVLSSIYEDGGRIPPAWVFGIMGGRMEKELQKQYGVDGNKQKEAVNEN